MVFLGFETVFTLLWTMLRAKEQYMKFLAIKTCFKRADVFVLLEHAKQFFLDRCQLHNQGKGAKVALAPFNQVI